MKVGRRQIENQVYTGIQRFYSPEMRGIPPALGCRYRSSRLERLYVAEKSTGSFYGHFFSDGRGDKGCLARNRSRDSLETVISPFINFYGLASLDELSLLV